MKFTKRTYDGAIARQQRRTNILFYYAKNPSVPMHIRQWVVAECERLNRSKLAVFRRGLANGKVRV